MLPRIPLVKSFWEYNKAGKELAKLHLNYEDQEPLSEVQVTGVEKGVFEVDKIRFKVKGIRDTIVYNQYISITNIPEICYSYTVNGKSPIEWIMERFQDSINKDTQIRNNPNDWGKEHNNPKYILHLLLSVMRVSYESKKIVDSLPNIAEELS